MKKTRKVDARFSIGGEEIPDAQLSIRLPTPAKIPDWIRLFERGLCLLSSGDFTKSEYKLLFFVLARTDWNNEWWLEVDLAWAVTGIDKTNLSKIVRGLESKGVIVPIYKIGKKQVYRPNQLLSWKGNGKLYPTEEEQKAFVQDILELPQVLNPTTGEIIDLFSEKLRKLGGY